MRGKQIKKEPNDQPQAADRNRPLWKDLAVLLVKAGAAVLFIWLMFTYVYGITKGDGMMAPSFQAGDLVFYYRLEKNIAEGDVVVYERGQETSEYRVVAEEGDTVDIQNGSLTVNGYGRDETYLYGAETEAWENGIRFPVTVGTGQVFLLCDDRTEATDSRIFGCVDKKDIKGKVILVMRRRSI